jgi:hypothetical protein
MDWSSCVCSGGVSDCSSPSTDDLVKGFDDPTSQSAKGYSSKFLEASWSACGFDSCDPQVVGLACHASECTNHSP